VKAPKGPKALIKTVEIMHWHRQATALTLLYLFYTSTYMRLLNRVEPKHILVCTEQALDTISLLEGPYLKLRGPQMY